MDDEAVPDPDPFEDARRLILAELTEMGYAEVATEVNSLARALAGALHRERLLAEPYEAPVDPPVFLDDRNRAHALALAVDMARSVEETDEKETVGRARAFFGFLSGAVDEVTTAVRGGGLPIPEDQAYLHQAWTTRCESYGEFFLDLDDTSPARRRCQKSSHRRTEDHVWVGAPPAGGAYLVVVWTDDGVVVGQKPAGPHGRAPQENVYRTHVFVLVDRLEMIDAIRDLPG